MSATWAAQAGFSASVGAASGWYAEFCLRRLNRSPEPRYRWLGLVLTGALVCSLTAAVVGWTPVLPAHLVLGFVSLPLAAIDFAVHRLPNAILLPAYPAAAVLLLTAAVVDDEPARVVRAGAAAVLLLGVFLTIGLLSELGVGDIRLAGLLGLYLGWHGWREVLLGPLVGFLLAAVVTGTLLALRRVRWRTRLPLGPYLLLGTFVVIALA